MPKWNFRNQLIGSNLPRGYEGSRQVALKALGHGLFSGNLFNTGFYTPAPEASRDLPQAVTAREALDDLPRITLHLEGKMKRGTTTI